MSQENILKTGNSYGIQIRYKGENNINTMELDNCKFCGHEAVFETDFIWNERVRCGCRTTGCRGYILDSPCYHSFEEMWKQWNRRPEFHDVDEFY